MNYDSVPMTDELRQDTGKELYRAERHAVALRRLHTQAVEQARFTYRFSDIVGKYSNHHVWQIYRDMAVRHELATYHMKQLERALFNVGSWCGVIA